MKLLVILLCLLSERYLVHAVSYLRFTWFSSYYTIIKENLVKIKINLVSLSLLVLVVLPMLIIWGIALYIADHWFFGFLCFLLNLLIFYYCLGPDNPFYPIREDANEQNPEVAAGHYFAQVNNQLFAVIFWYVILGPLGVLFYRLVSLCRLKEPTAALALKITNLLDWIPARITVFLYLIVGNFQKGFHFFAQNFISPPDNNERLLYEGGLLAARTNEKESVQLTFAENLVEHALVVYLVFFALFTLVALL